MAACDKRLWSKEATVENEAAVKQRGRGQRKRRPWSSKRPRFDKEAAVQETVHRQNRLWMKEAAVDKEAVDEGGHS